MEGNGSPTSVFQATNKSPVKVNSDFLTAKAPARKSARLSSALLNYRRPEGLNLVPLGSSWALDVFARIHNGTRRELIDMYNMIDSMQKRVQDLRSTDLKLFFRWWDLFSSYLEVSFDLHGDILVPWVEKKTSMPASLNESTRREMRGRVHTLLQNFDTIYSQLSRRPPDETMAKIIKSLVDVHPIVEYYEKFENNIPDTIEQQYKAKDAKSIERSVARYLHKTGDSEVRRLHLSIMCRAMTDEVLSAWTKLQPPLLRFSYRSNSKKFEGTHLLAAQKLAAE